MKINVVTLVKLSLLVEKFQCPIQFGAKEKTLRTRPQAINKRLNKYFPREIEN
jgi:hypothetical protein